MYIAATVRPLLPADWEAVKKIYLLGIATRNATFRQEAPAWEDWDKAHLPYARVTAVAGGQVVGWCALSPVSARPVYAGVAEVSVYVDTGCTGKGIGRQLLQQLIRESEANGIWTLQAAIFPENKASLRLHEQAGFRVVGYREKIGRMDGMWRDTILLERRSRVVI